MLSGKLHDFRQLIIQRGTTWTVISVTFLCFSDIRTKKTFILTLFPPPFPFFFPLLPRFSTPSSVLYPNHTYQNCSTTPPLPTLLSYPVLNFYSTTLLSYPTLINIFPLESRPSRTISASACISVTWSVPGDGEGNGEGNEFRSRVGDSYDACEGGGESGGESPLLHSRLWLLSGIHFHLTFPSRI